MKNNELVKYSSKKLVVGLYNVLKKSYGILNHLISESLNPFLVIEVSLEWS
jgi:hypothetical protein